jgi:hypothetical protein
LAKVKELMEQAEQLYRQDVENFPNIHFDRHLYQPLLLAHSEIDAMMPPGLNEGEAKFVRDLRDYLQRNNERFRGKEIFLLRNLTRSKGIGFFDTKSWGGVLSRLHPLGDRGQRTADCFHRPAWVADGARRIQRPQNLPAQGVRAIKSASSP